MHRVTDFSGEPEVLAIRGLTVRVDGAPITAAPILDAIDLTIRRGETLCLVGESGSGKSVTSLATMGLLPPGLIVTDGSIRLEGDELLTKTQNEMRALRAARVAMVFQEPMTALNPVLRVGDQILEVLELHGRSGAGAREKARDLLEQVHLPNIDRVMNAYPHELSGGQRQRIMIAMALILDPALLIADEPTTALDVTTQKQILALIDDLKRTHGAAVLFITHDMGVVAEIADTVAVMRNGRVVETAPIGEILRHPRKDYTRDLLTSVPSLTPRHPRSAPSEANPALKVDKLSKIYGSRGWLASRPGVKAADDVSFTLAAGRTLGIVGESGSGKSTVARCVMRLIDPTHGRVLLGGADIATLSRSQLRPHRRAIQVVFQDPYRSLNPRWTVAESLIEGPVNYGAQRTQALAEARRLLGVVGLPEDAMERYPHQFSGGQRQRIAIARAVAMKPDVLVADEAVSALDVSVQAQVLDLLDALQRELGIAILFITHDLRVAAQICDDVLVMRKGEVVEYGPAADVLANPRHEYTRDLIEAAPGRNWDFQNFREMPTHTIAGARPLA